MRGFAIIRGGILDHLLAGTISLYELGVYLVIHLQVDFQSGVWRGSAPRLLAAAPRGTGLREVQRALQNLVRQGFLKSFHVPGKRGNFCVLLDRYNVKVGALKGKRLIAAKSLDWRNPHYEPCAEIVADVDAEADVDGAPVSRVNKQETRFTRKDGHSPGRSSSTFTHPFAQIWNSSRGPLAEIKSFSSGRLAKCRAREREITEQDFREIVQLAAVTPFCIGITDRGWKVNFDWLIENDTNLLKVKEGRYSHGGSPNGPQHSHAATDAAAENIRKRFN
jgi:hypothetical protein